MRYGKIATMIQKKNKSKKRKNLTMVVLRISRDGQLQNSRPCSTCIRYLQQTGRVRKVIYSVDASGLVSENLSLMVVNGYESVGTRLTKKKATSYNNGTDR